MWDGSGSKRKRGRLMVRSAWLDWSHLVPSQVSEHDVLKSIWLPHIFYVVQLTTLFLLDILSKLRNPMSFWLMAPSHPVAETHKIQVEHLNLKYLWAQIQVTTSAPRALALLDHLPTGAVICLIVDLFGRCGSWGGLTSPLARVSNANHFWFVISIFTVHILTLSYKII